MYIPAHFGADHAVVDELLAKHGAADLITLTSDGLIATLLPFAYDPAAGERGTLYGHVARNTDQWRKPALGESLAIVRGPNAYVSPSWYAAKAEHGKVVPTWNYTAVHLSGTVRVHDEIEWLRSAVRQLTDLHEQGRGQPWHVTDAPPDYIDAQLGAIIGLEITIGQVEGKAKLSQ